MKGNNRYPLLLLVSLLGTAFVDLAGASPVPLPRHFQPNYVPLFAPEKVERFTPRYRFRPVSGIGVKSPYRLAAARYFGGYYGAAMPPAHAYSPRFRPVRSNAPRFAGRNAWGPAGYAFPRAGYFRTNYFGYPAGTAQAWRGPPISHAFAQGGYKQPRMPARFRAAWSGGQSRYLGRFRPLPVNRPASPAVVSAHRAWQMPAYQRPFRRPHFAPHVSPWPQQAPFDLATSAPRVMGSRKMADSRRYPLNRAIKVAPVDRRIAIPRNRYQAYNARFSQRGLITPPRHVTWRPAPSSGFTGTQRYRFRPGKQMVNSQQAAGAMESEHRFSDGMSGRLAFAGYRFRPDNRLSRKLPTASRQWLPITATYSEPASASYSTDRLSRFPETGFRPLRFDLTDSLDTADLYYRSEPIPIRSKGIYKFRSIAEITTG